VTVALDPSGSGKDGEKFVVVMSGFQKRFLLSRQRIDLRMALMAPVAQCVSAAKLVERIVVSTILFKCITCKEGTWAAVLPWMGKTKASARGVPSTIVGRVCPKFQAKTKYDRAAFEGRERGTKLAEELLSLPTFQQECAHNLHVLTHASVAAKQGHWVVLRADGGGLLHLPRRVAQRRCACLCQP